MATKTLEDIIQDVNDDGQPGETTSDDVLKRRVLREVIYRESDLIAVGTNVLPERSFDQLDIEFQFPSEINAEYPVGENSIVDRSKVTWREMDVTLHQAEARFMITDMARLREQDSLQNEISTQRAAEALADEKDANILNTLHAGSPADNTITLDRTADEGWDQSGSEIESNVVTAWNRIFDHSNVSENDVEDSHLIVPAAVYGQLNTLQLINNVQQNLRDYLEESYGMNIWFTRTLDTDAVMAVGGEETGVHGVLETDDIPFVEEERQMGRGTDVLTRQFFNTGIMEDTGLNGENYRITTIENVASS